MTGEPTASGPASDPAVSVVGPGEGETILLGTTLFRVLEDGSNTGHRLGFAESVLAPHTSGPPLHRHAQYDEGFRGDRQISLNIGLIIAAAAAMAIWLATTWL